MCVHWSGLGLQRAFTNLSSQPFKSTFILLLLAETCDEDDYCTSSSSASSNIQLTAVEAGFGESISRFLRDTLYYQHLVQGGSEFRKWQQPEYTFWLNSDRIATTKSYFIFFTCTCIKKLSFPTGLAATLY